MKACTFIVFGDDWGRHPSSSQHLIRGFADRHRILWVNSIGMRTPRLSLYDIQRVFQRVKQMTSGRSSQAGDTKSLNPRVVQPRFIPFHGWPAARFLNRISIGYQLYKLLTPRPERVVVWISNPLAAYVAGEVNPDLLIYYCGDDFLEFPGIDRPLVERQERYLLERADLSIFSSRRLMEIKGKRAKGKVAFVPHGVDLDRFIGPKPLIPEELAHIKRPLIGYFGIFSDWIDLDLLREAAKRDTSLSFVLMGEPNAAARKLALLPNVQLLGRVPYEDLPRYARQLDVGLLLYRINDMTAAISPLKMYECFAMGLPVVSTLGFQGLDGDDKIMKANTPDDFISCIHEALSYAEPRRKELVQIAARNTWSERHKTLSSLIEQNMQR